MSKDTSGPAFPIVDETERVFQPGLTKREWFAGMAILGMMASESSGNGVMPEYEPGATWPQRTAVKAIVFADALLAELNKETKP